MPMIMADLRDLDRLDIRGQGTPVPPLPPRRILNNAEKAALKAAVELSALFVDEVPAARIIKQLIDISENRPSIVVRKPNHVQVNESAVTFAVGFNPEAFLVGGVTGTVGVYASTTGEFGLFGSIGPGLWFPNIGASIAGTLTEIFGPPSDLSGFCIGIGCEVVWGPTWGGVLLIAPGSPWPRFLGFTVSVGTPSAVPFDITYQATYTGRVILVES